MLMSLKKTLICFAAILAVCAGFTLIHGWNTGKFAQFLVIAGLASSVLGVGFSSHGRPPMGSGLNQRIAFDSFRMEGNHRQAEDLDFMYLSGAACVIAGFAIMMLL